MTETSPSPQPTPRDTPAPNAPVSPEPAAADTAQATAGNFLVYTLSLPERAVRTTVGLAAGVVREAADFLTPQAFQSCKTYELAVGKSLQFLTRDIGGVQRAGDVVEDNDDYLARKAVGNFLDLAGLATLHVSPVWMLAAFSDLAYGSRSYISELAAELQRQGLIDESSTIHHADELLSALQQVSGEAAGTFDTPPLSVEELRKSLERARTAAAKADIRGMLPEAEIRRMWDEMQQTASQQDVGLLEVSTAMTMQTLSRVQTVSRGAITSVQVVGGIFNRHVIGHFQSSLTMVQERGLYQLVSETSAPYVAAVWQNFSLQNATWTADLLEGRTFTKWGRKLAQWWRGKDNAADASSESNATSCDPPTPPPPP